MAKKDKKKTSEITTRYAASDVADCSCDGWLYTDLDTCARDTEAAVIVELTVARRLTQKCQWVEVKDEARSQ